MLLSLSRNKKSAEFAMSRISQIPEVVHDGEDVVVLARPDRVRLGPRDHGPRHAGYETVETGEAALHRLRVAGSCHPLGRDCKRSHHKTIFQTVKKLLGINYSYLP